MDKLSSGEKLIRLDLWHMEGEWGVEMNDDGASYPADLAGDVMMAYTKYVQALKDLKWCYDQCKLWRRGVEDGQEIRVNRYGEDEGAVKEDPKTCVAEDFDEMMYDAAPLGPAVIDEAPQVRVSLCSCALCTSRRGEDQW